MSCACSPVGLATQVSALTGDWDPARPTEGAYSALLAFEGGAFASLTYSGYGRFDSDEWMGWTGELGHEKNPDDYGRARRALAAARTPDAESALKRTRTFGAAAAPAAAPHHEHFGPVVVCCERGDIRLTPDGIWVYGDERRFEPAPRTPDPRTHDPRTPDPRTPDPRTHDPRTPDPRTPDPRTPDPRTPVLDALVAAVRDGIEPVQTGRWGLASLEVCHAILHSARNGAPVQLTRQVAAEPGGNPK